MKKNFGFTLVEILVVLALVAILAAVAVPSYRAMIQNNRAATQANELVAALNLARSEAIKRGLPAAVCASVDQSTCSGSVNWATGWIVFTDDSGVAGARDGTDLILVAQQEQMGNPTITGGAASIRYLASGSTNGGVNFNVSLPDCTGEQARTISIAQSGRSAISTANCP